MENNSKEARDAVKPLIANIKGNMNSLKTDYEMPKNHQFLVTEN
jgi:hypothetical protein